MTPTKDDLISAIAEIREDDVAQIVRAQLDAGTDPLEIVAECREALTLIGKRFEEGEAFIPELIMAGEIMTSISSVLRPLLAADGGERLGCVVLGTVKGDIHDIGKDIVGTLLDAGGFEVVDLGVDVAPEQFIDAIGERRCTVALSCMLTTGFESMKKTIDAITAAGLRDQVRIMVGGAPITENVRAFTGADGFGTDAAAALELAESWADGGAA